MENGANHSHISQCPHVPRYGASWAPATDLLKTDKTPRSAYFEQYAIMTQENPQIDSPPQAIDMEEDLLHMTRIHIEDLAPSGVRDR